MGDDTTVVRLDQVHPAGHTGIATHFLGRYREFDYCMARLMSPPGSSYQYYMSVDVCSNFNQMVRHMIKNPKFEWLWILGDDHVFNPDLLIKLLDRNVDVVTPLCCRRMSPYLPILHTELTPEGCGSLEDPWEPLTGKTGLFEWEGTSGNAGMLIRRHVIEAMKDPLFENGKASSGVGASDLYFWHKLHEHGFKTYLDLDNIIGHLTHIVVWPEQNEESGKWSYRMTAP